MIKLSPYQHTGLFDLARNDHFALLWSMRLRKTAVCIRYIQLYMLYPVLISAPFSAIYDWKEQLINAGIKEENIIIIPEKPSKQFRKEQLNKLNRIYIMNHDCYRSVPEIGKMFFACMILDEAHILRNPKTRISSFYIKNFRDVKHRIILTGTWIAESELDLIQLFRFLDHNYTAPHGNYWQCRHALFVNDRFEWKMKPQGKKYFGNLLKNYATVLEYADVGIKDRINEIYYYVKINDTVRDYYNNLLQKFILEDDHVQKSTIFATVNYVWMRMLLSGHIENRLLNTAKLEQLDLLLKTEFRNKKVVIWCYYKEEVKAIADYLHCPYLIGDLKINEREKIKKEFCKGKLNRIVIIARKGVATEGTNLSPADGQIYLTVPESALILNQSKRRIFDIDQPQIKPCIYFVTKDTVEEKIIDAHKRKLNVKNVVYEYLKGMRSESKFHI